MSGHEHAEEPPRRGDLAESLRLCREDLARAEESGDHRRMALGHSRLGITLTRAGRTAEAVAHCVVSVNLLVRLGSPDLRVNLRWLARQRAVLGDAGFRAVVEQYAVPGWAGSILEMVEDEAASPSG